MQDSLVEDRRKSKRIIPKPEAPVEIHIIGNECKEIFHVKDISCGGAKIYAPYHFAGNDIYSEIKIRIKLPRILSFTIHGMIRHILSNNPMNDFFGIEFLDLTPTQKEMIEKYIYLHTI